MRWVKADYYMYDRTVRFVASRRSLIEHGFSQETIRRAAELGPELLESCFRTILENARPELSGAVLLYVGFAPSDLSWEAVVSHASLPVRPLWEEVKCEPLWLESGGDGSLRSFDAGANANH